MKKADFKRIVKGLWQVADPKIWVASTVPMAAGASLAYGLNGAFNLYWLLVAMAAVYLIETGKNAINEAVDYKSGVDLMVKHRTPFSGGKKSIIDGLLTPLQAGLIGIAATGAACLLGLYILLYREASLIYIGIAGVFLSAAYSVPPFKLAYRGLGEITVGLVFGPLITMGMYLLMTGSLTGKVFWLSLPIGFMIANILIINQFPDYEADAAGNKKNWVVRLGKQKGVRLFAAVFVLAYISFIAAALISGNYFWLMGLITAPLALKAIKIAGHNYDNIPLMLGANMLAVQIYQSTGILYIIIALSHRWL